MKISWHLRRIAPDQWAGTLVLPFDARKLPGGGMTTITAKGADKATALGKAAVLAKQAITNPLVAAILPPGAGAAVTAISALSKSAAGGYLADAAKTFTGPGLNRISKALGGLF